MSEFYRARVNSAEVFRGALMALNTWHKKTFEVNAYCGENMEVTQKHSLYWLGIAIHCLADE
jgi:hypothetical protein